MRFKDLVLAYYAVNQIIVDNPASSGQDGLFELSKWSEASVENRSRAIQQSLEAGGYVALLVAGEAANFAAPLELALAPLRHRLRPRHVACSPLPFPLHPIRDPDGRPL